MSKHKNHGKLLDDTSADKGTERKYDAYAVNIDEQEASLRYGPSVHWFRRSRWAGDGPRFIKLAGKVLYPVVELDAYFTSRIRKSTSDSGSHPCGAQCACRK